MTSPAKTSTIQRHFTRILSLWPPDPLRPRLAFHDYIKARASIAASTTTTNPNPNTTTTNSNTTTTNTPAPPTNPTTPAPLLKDVNALYTLLDDRYMKKYPISKATLHPASNPHHYHALMAEIRDAPGRSLAQRLWKRVSGMVRLR